eukprot:Colp12_sorted_trinity150504_noHs@19806
MGFLTSTHRKHWLFASQAELDAKRLKANEEARADIKKLSSKVSDSAFLGAEDEKKFVNYMLQKLKQFCESGLTIPAPPKVVATASTYFKRFYLKNSMMNYDPSDMMFVCVFLACKVEEFFQTLDEFVRKLGTKKGEKTKKYVLEHEVVLATELNYDLTVHSPFHALHGLAIDVRARCDAVSGISATTAEAQKLIMNSYLTDVILLYPPSQLSANADGGRWG